VSVVPIVLTEVGSYGIGFTAIGGNPIVLTEVGLYGIGLTAIGGNPIGVD